MNEYDTEQMKNGILAGARAVLDHEQYLCELDGYVGDGDHGVTAARGFHAVIELLETTEISSLELLFKNTGATLARQMGGAIGPIFGSIFSGAAGAFSGTDCTLDSFAQGMEKALALVKAVGGAKEGDRTLVDALSPYAVSLKSSTASSLSFQEALILAAKASDEGAESTKLMQAVKGRARFLGEKSIGYRDAGASSFTIFVSGLAGFFQ